MTAYVASFAILTAVMLVSCSREITPEDARAELGRLNVPYNEKSLIESAANGDLKAVDLFLKAGMKPDVRDASGTLAADLIPAGAHRDKLATMMVFQEQLDQLGNIYGGRDQTLGMTPLMAASVNGRSSIVTLLLKSNANTEMKDRFDMTALMYAAWQGHADVVRSLLNAGADKGYFAKKLKVNVVEAASISGNAEVVTLVGTGEPDK